MGVFASIALACRIKMVGQVILSEPMSHSPMPHSPMSHSPMPHSPMPHSPMPHVPVPVHGATVPACGGQHQLPPLLPPLSTQPSPHGVRSLGEPAAPHSEHSTIIQPGLPPLCAQVVLSSLIFLLAQPDGRLLPSTSSLFLAPSLLSSVLVLYLLAGSQSIPRTLATVSKGPSLFLAC